MTGARYKPVRQSAAGQIVDSIVIILFVIAALLLPPWFGLVGTHRTQVEIADKTTWAGLGQSAAQQAQWEKLGQTPATAAPMISTRFNYEFNLPEFLMVALLVIAYFVVLVRLSRVEYRDVIDERFGKK